MSEQRLSDLQRCILKSLYEVIQADRNEDNETGYNEVYTKSREKNGIKADTLEDYPPTARNMIRMCNPNPIYHDNNFKSSFSRSIRNLEIKGLVRLKREYIHCYFENHELKDCWYTGSKKVNYIEITDGGLLLISNIDNKVLQEKQQESSLK